MKSPKAEKAAKPVAETNSNGAPPIEGTAAAVSTMAAGGDTASKPEGTGQSSGTNTSEDGATAKVGAGDLAGLASGATIAAAPETKVGLVGEIAPETVFPTKLAAALTAGAPVSAEAVSRDADSLGTSNVAVVVEGTGDAELAEAVIRAAGRAFDPRGDVLRVTRMNRIQNLAEQVKEDRHARILSLFTSTQFPEDSPPAAIRVICSTEGFRRAGQRHPAGAVDYELDHFTADQLEQLLGDATFTVELV